MNRYTILAACAAILAGCHHGSDDDQPETHVHGGVQYGEFDCSTRATPAPDLETVDTSMTPRADAAAELLALEASGEFIAPEGLYQRVSAELMGIKGGFPDKTSTPNSCLEQDERVSYKLGLVMTETAYDAAANGTYDAWNALNGNLGAAVTLDQDTHAAKLDFDGRYNINSLVDAYAELPGVTNVLPVIAENRWFYPAYDACLTVRDTFHYYIFHVESNCNTVCDLDYYGFEADASGNIRYLGVYHFDFGNTPEPAWFSELHDCRAFLIQ